MGAIPPAASSRTVKVRTVDREDSRGPLEASNDRRGARLTQSIGRVERDKLALLAKLVDAGRDRRALDGGKERGEHVVGPRRPKGLPGGLVEGCADAHGRHGAKLLDQDLLIHVGRVELFEGKGREKGRVGATGATVRSERLLVQ